MPTSFDPLSVSATFLSGFSEVMEGISANKDAKADAAQLKDQSNLRIAQGTRAAYEEARQGRRVVSNAVAANAAGGGAGDAGQIERVAQISDNNDYNVLATLYSARTEADQLDYASRVRKRQGRQEALTSGLRAIPSILDGADQVFGENASALRDGPKSVNNKRKGGLKL